jgi:hypothetical protein
MPDAVGGGVTPVSPKVNCSCRVTAAAATGQPPLPEKGYYCCCRQGNLLITFLTAQGCASKRSQWEKARKWCCAAVPHTASPLDPTTPLPSYLLDPPVCPVISHTPAAFSLHAASSERFKSSPSTPPLESQCILYVSATDSHAPPGPMLPPIPPNTNWCLAYAIGELGKL